MTPAGWQDLASRFGLGPITGDPAYVTRGAMGEVWRLDTTGGRWAVKWQFPWSPADARPLDVPVQLAAAKAGIPLPLPVLAPDGVALAEVAGRPARVYEWVDLAEPAELPASAATAAEAGRLLGLLHGLALPAGEPVDPWYTEVPDAEVWIDLVERARAAAASWAAGLASALGLIAELTASVVPAAGRPPLVCHRDFNPENVLPAADDGRLVVLDWENCGPLSPDQELGYAIFCWCAGNGSFDQAAADTFVAEYVISSGAAVAIEPGFFTTAIATHVNVLRVMAEQALADDEHRAFAEEFIAPFLDHYLEDLRDLVKLSLTGRWPG